MKLSSFSTLAATFAAGLILSGCAAPGMYQQGYQSPYANAAPAYMPVTDPATGQTHLVPAQQGYNQPRYPYGYQNAQRQNANYSGVGMIGGALLGNAVSHGSAGAIAAGAIGGAALGASGDPCGAQLNAGTAIGAVLGYALGSKVGQGNGRKVAEVGAALIGANAGGQMSSGPRPGCR